GERPVAILLDDLHAAPDAAVGVFAALAAAAPSMRLLLVATSVNGLEDLRGCGAEAAAQARRIQLARLGLKDMARLLIEALGSQQLADEIGFPVVLRADGNPFFMLEILREMRRGGALVQKDDGKWALTRSVSEIGVPSSLA